MKLDDVEKLYPILTSIGEKELPIRLAYKFTKFISQIERDYNFYIEETKKIVYKYAEKNEQGEIIFSENGTITLQKEHVSDAEQSLKDLAEIEVETPSITFTLDELESLSITPADLQNLLPFIEE